MLENMQFVNRYYSLPDNVITSSADWNELIDDMRALGYDNDLTLTDDYHIRQTGIVRLGYKVYKTPHSMQHWCLVANLEDKCFSAYFQPALKDGDLVGVKDKMTGGKALREIKKLFKRFNGLSIDEFYHITSSQEGIDAKLSIPSTLIGPLDEYDCAKTFTNCHHIDINSAFPAGLKERYPAFDKVIDYLYAHKKMLIGDSKQYYKDILNMMIGKMQSIALDYKYAMFSKAAIEWVNDKIIAMTYWLQDRGCKVLCYNTDGLWFQGDIPEDLVSSEKLGEWKIDHKNCKFRMKNANYEYVEDGIYTPVVRGRTRLDTIKPRTEWVWGDIFQNSVDIGQVLILDETTGKLNTINGVWIDE